MRLAKDILLGLAVSFFMLLMMCGLGEIALRFLPVRSAMLSEPVDAARPIFRLAPDRPFVYSLGGDFENVNRGRVNKAGFVNDQEYVRDDPRPLLAVIGDSFVEALMVPYAQTLQGRLQAAHGAARVYSFAASGAPFSQYLAWAEYAVRDYRAKALAIVVVGNDYAESLASYGVKPGMHQYRGATDGKLVWERADFAPAAWRGWLARSALVRYLWLNLKLPDRLAALRHLGTPQEFAGFTPAQLPEELVRDSLAAIDAFLAELQLRTGLAPDRIAFLVDGFRYPDAASGQDGSYFATMRNAFLQRARQAGFVAIDLDPLFFADFAATGQRFDFPNDGHWSGAGHEVAAKALIENGFPARELASPQIR